MHSVRIWVINNRKVPGIRAFLADLGHNGPSVAPLPTMDGSPYLSDEIKDR